MQLARIEEGELVVPRRFRLAEYHRLLEVGVLGREERLELLEGLIAESSPEGAEHGWVVGRLEHALRQVVPEGWVLRRQCALSVGGDSEPVPDLALVGEREGAREGAREGEREEALLVVEVAEASLLKDRELKGRLYARAGVPEYWVVDVAGRRVEVYTSPDEASGLYHALCTVRAVELLTSLSVPGLELPVDSLFGG